MNIISKNIIEIRYKPDPQILDIKGKIVQYLTNSSKFFDTWNITGNDITLVSTKNKNLRAFFTFKRWALESINPISDDDFIQASTEIIQNSSSLINIDKITRLGVRSTYIIGTELTFNDLLKEMNGKISKFDTTKISNKLIDTAFTFTFAEDNNKVNISFGPMSDEQIKENFIDSKDLPKNGLFVDIDTYCSKFEKQLKTKDIVSFLKDAIKNGRGKAITIFESLNLKDAKK